MSNNPTFTVAIQPVGDHLWVTIPELGVTVQTTGTTRREAEQAALRAIDKHLQKTHKPHARRPKTQRPKASSKIPGDETEKYTIRIQPVGDHLQVTIAEIDITVETAPGKIKREDAERAATRAISAYVLAQREAIQVK